MPLTALLDKTTHNRESFSCGKSELDTYLHQQAAQDVSKHATVCYILADEDDPSRVIGYYTLSNFSIQLSNIPAELSKQIPKYPEVPATLLGRLAVDTEYRGKGLGEFLLLDALRRALEYSETTSGSVAVVVDAKDEEARGFYLKYGFIQLTSDPNRILILMGTVKKLFP